MHKKLLAFCLCMLMSAFALAGCTTDPVIATVGDVNIYNSEFRELFDSYAIYYGIDDATSEANADAVAYLRDLILDRLIEQNVQLIKAKELSLDQLTDEMTAEIQAEVDSAMDGLYEYFQSEALTNDPTLTGDSLAANVQESMDAYLAEVGYSEQRLLDEYTDQYIMNSLYDYTTEDITVPEEQVRSTYDTRVEQTREIYAEDPTAFESDFYSSVTLYTIPKGYRHVKHILIALSSETINQIATLRTAGEDAAADTVRDVALKDIHEEAEAVLSLLDPLGANFDQIMDIYSDDGDSTELPNGYAVCRDGQFAEQFVDACFAFKKTQTLSGLIAGDYGYHIILYIEPLQAGDVPYEELKADVEAELVSVAREDAFTQQCADWRNEMAVALYIDKIVYATPEVTTTLDADLTLDENSATPTPAQ